jgi:hypothetical protein
MAYGGYSSRSGHDRWSATLPLKPSPGCTGSHFSGWNSQVLAGLTEPTAAKPAAKAGAHTREPVLRGASRQANTHHASSSKQTVHVSFNLADGDMHCDSGLTIPAERCGLDNPEGDPDHTK